MTRPAVLFSLLPLALALPCAAMADERPARTTAQDSAVTIDLRAIEEMAGPEAAARVDADMRRALPQATGDHTGDQRPDDAPAPVIGQGETLQIIYARGNLVISPSAKETLDDWIESFLKPESRVEILSYSGSARPAWSKAAAGPATDAGGDIMTYSLHEAIRTAFKRALVIRDILMARGVPESRITLRAIGPTGDQGPPERIDVIALRD